MGSNLLYYGDNLVWLRDNKYFPDESIDLIYLDPPFNSNADYNVIFKEPSGEQSKAQLQAFDDTWKWDSDASAIAQRDLAYRLPELSKFIDWLGEQQGSSYRSMAAYLSMMAVRLVELQRVLRATGSIYLHCDSTASHYLKVIMDIVFGVDNFKNEIVWKRQTAHKGTKRYGKVHDIILCYGKSDEAKWRPQFTDFSEEYKDRFYRYTDESGRRYTLSDLMAAGVRHGSSGMPWHGVDPTTRGRHWQFTIEDLEKLDREGRIYYPPKGGVPRYKRYLDEMKGIAPQDMWLDIPPVQAHSKEKLGYQTQKPQALLERIISQSSDEGDVVLDPFCGCGTALVAANKLKRIWVGIDITHLSIFLIEQRLKDSFGESIKDTYKVYGNPEDIESAQALWNESPKEFELWALSLVDARPRPRDGGVDGVLGFVDEGRQTKKIVVQVKGGKHLEPTIMRDLIGTVNNEKAVMGLLITLHETTPKMVEHAVHSTPYYSPLWDRSFPSIQIRTIHELIIEHKGFELPPQVTTLRQAERIREQGQSHPML